MQGRFSLDSRTNYPAINTYNLRSMLPLSTGRVQSLEVFKNRLDEWLWQTACHSSSQHQRVSHRALAGTAFSFPAVICWSCWRWSSCANSSCSAALSGGTPSHLPGTCENTMAGTHTGSSHSCMLLLIEQVIAELQFKQSLGFLAQLDLPLAHLLRHPEALMRCFSQVSFLMF